MHQEVVGASGSLLGRMPVDCEVSGIHTRNKNMKSCVLSTCRNRLKSCMKQLGMNVIWKGWLLVQCTGFMLCMGLPGLDSSHICRTSSPMPSSLVSLHLSPPDCQTQQARPPSTEHPGKGSQKKKMWQNCIKKDRFCQAHGISRGF